METIANADIQFYGQDTVSVYLEGNTTGRQQKLAEVGLFTLYSLRTLSNLGRNRTSDALGEMLQCANEIVHGAALQKYPGGLSLVTYPGHPGKKGFHAVYRSGEQGIQFDCKMKGFGWFATGMGYYGPTSVIALLSHLCAKRPADRCYLECLARAGRSCGTLQLEDKVGLTNQIELGQAILAMSCDALRDSTKVASSEITDLQTKCLEHESWHPWDCVRGDLEERFGVLPEDWKKLNFKVDSYVRKKLRWWYLDTKGMADSARSCPACS